ncbi:BAG family molecular chaperone regulator 8 [Hibiscus syriacus]|uniref:BAG family molecular chaperone regulator 8 n=1 Tax=Hibiscus syriacus TaxID=106335 RepID=A0A6A3AGN1_HIBSY|nr:BAG family molecular chaperone regulator 8 [Hibiscus syriacus]
MQTFGQTEINWYKNTRQTKFYLVGAGIFTGVTVALHPVSVVKTRLQVASKDTVDRNAFSVIRGILKTDGVPGLYRGFGTVITGAIPARVIFLTALETTKVAASRMVEPFKFSEPTQAAIVNGIAGMTASLFAQVMVQANGLYGVSCVVIAFIVIFSLSFMAGTAGLSFPCGKELNVLLQPATKGYGFFTINDFRFLDKGNTDLKETAPSTWTIVSVQAAGGIIAGTTASCITTPLDNIKTRLQVMGHEKRHSTRQVVKSLIAYDGWKGFYRGFGPRFFSMSA